jgi:hypothetical protein
VLTSSLQSPAQTSFLKPLLAVNHCGQNPERLQDYWENYVTRIDEYREALRLAAAQLQLVQLRDVAQRAGARCEPGELETATLELPFFSDPVQIRIGAAVEIIRPGEQGDTPIEEQILLCHYLLHAKGTPPSGNHITFRQIPDGHFYDEAFQKRTRDPFLATFGSCPELFRTCAQRMHGEPVDMGDVGMVFYAFPRIPIQLILWQGDEELPPESTILFDSSINDYLPAEDIAVLSGILVYRLMGVARKIKTE